MGTTYEKDVVVWAQEQAQLLRSGKLTESVQTLLRWTLSDLLMIECMPLAVSRDSFIEDIAERRNQLEVAFSISPCLRQYSAECFDRALRQARLMANLALLVVGIEPVKVPAECLFTLEQVIDHEYLPIFDRG